MKKVLMISGSLPPIKCGVGYYTQRLLQELSGRAEVEVLSTTGVNDDLSQKLYTVNDWRLGSLPKILSIVKSSGAGIVHVQYPAVGYKRNLGINLLPYALRILHPKLKIIVTLHEYHESRWLGRWRDSITVLPAHKIIVSNQSDWLALKSLRSKVELVPIGPNFDKAPKDPEYFGRLMAKHKLDMTKTTVLFFGFAERNKQLEV